MTRTEKHSRFCAVVIILVFCVLFAWKLPGYYAEIYSQVKSTIESHYASPPNEEFLKRQFWYYLNFTGRKYVNGNYVLNDGRLVAKRYSSPTLLEARAGEVIRLNNYLKSKDMPFLFLRAPDPMRDNSDMPKGYKSTVIEDVSRFLLLLDENDVNYIDLRKEMTNDFDSFASTFFWGDHHWTVDGALWAWGELGLVMNSKYGFNVDPKTWDLREYERITFKKTFLGSASAQVGGIKEDIDALIPKFATSFEISNKALKDDTEQDILASGEFIDVFMPAARYENTQFVYWGLNAYGDGPIRQFKNKAAQEEKKVLLIADSFGCAFATYLSTALENMDYFYLQLDNKNNQEIYPMLENEKYDLVLYLSSDGLILGGGNEIEKDRMYLGESLS